MRFRRLALEAYGPFVGETLDFGERGPGGLHVVYGPNGAGKSTTLRGVSALLFGFPQRSPDAYLHGSGKLRIAATIEDHGGQPLDLVRLKRQKDSLVDPSGVPLAPASPGVDVLSELLGGMDRDTFEARFGLGQEALARGAEALLGGSEEGLFAAGTGGADAVALLRGLDEQLQDTYRQRGQKYPLNQVLGALDEAERRVSRAVTPPESWLLQKRAHDEAKQELEAIEAERSRVRLELGVANRQRSLLSEVHQHQECLRALAELGEVALLPESAEAERLAFEGELREATVESRSALREVERVKGEIAELSAPDPLALLPEGRLKDLQARAGSEEKAQRDLPKRRAALVVQREEIARRLVRLGRPGVDPASLLVDARTERALRRLSTEEAGFEARTFELERRVQRLTREIAAVEPATIREESAPFDRALVRGLVRAAETLLVEGRAERWQRVPELRTELARLRSELGRTDAPQSIIAEEDVEALLAERARVERLEGEAAASIEAARRALLALDGEEQTLLRDGEVASVEQLAEERCARDAQFGELVGALGRGERGLDRVFSYERALARADQTADRLRTDAARVQAKESIGKRRTETMAEIERSEAALLAAKAARERARTRWEELFGCAGIRPPSPASARNVLRLLARSMEIETELSQREAELVAHEAREAELSQRLSACVGRESELGVLVERARALLDGAEQGDLRRAQAAERRAQLGAELGEEQAALDAAREKRAAFEGQWREWTRRASLPSDVSAAEVSEHLSELGALAKDLDAALELERRIAGIERDSRELFELVDELSARLPEEVRARPLLARADALLESARAAREVEERRRALNRELEARRERHTDAERRRELAEAGLEALVARARVGSPSELAEAERRSSKYRELRSQVERIERVVSAKAPGVPMDEVVRELSDKAYGPLTARIDELEADQARLDEDFTRAHRELESRRQGLSLYGSDVAANERQAVEAHRAEARALLGDYLVKKAAKLLLEAEMERYASEHQGPILARAAELLARMTLGAFSRLRVRLGERALYVVHGKDEKEVQVLSSGERAQLYLALRLASLERYFETHQPVPLVFDDLFVEFDDDRTTAAFEVLGELSEKVQILYFTHLSRDIEAASSAVPAGRFRHHQLRVR